MIANKAARNSLQRFGLYSFMIPLCYKQTNNTTPPGTLIAGSLQVLISLKFKKNKNLLIL
jgi:hypothetical protein